MPDGRIKKNEPYPKSTTKNIQTSDIFFLRGRWHHNVGAVREEFICACLAKGSNEPSLVDFYLGRDYLSCRLEYVAFLRLPDANDIRCAPFVLKAVPAQRNSLRTFF